MDRCVLLLETLGSIVGSSRWRAGFPPPTRQPSPAVSFIPPSGGNPTAGLRPFALPRSHRGVLERGYPDYPRAPEKRSSRELGFRYPLFSVTWI
jgi:hypothetical protein